MEIFTRKFLSMSRRLISRAKIQQNHRAIMEALTDRDLDALDRAITDHMRQTSVVLAGRDGRNGDRGNRHSKQLRSSK